MLAHILELKEQLKDTEALKTEAESQLEQIQEKYYALVKKTQKLEMQVSQLKTKVLLPKKPEPAPTPAEKEFFAPKTPVAAPAPVVSALGMSPATKRCSYYTIKITPFFLVLSIEGGAKRKSPDRDDDGRKRIRPFMDITVTDQRPPIASKPKAKVEVKPVEEVSEYEPPQAQKESTLNSEGPDHFFFFFFPCFGVF